MSESEQPTPTDTPVDFQSWPVYYTGRKWDAPFTDDAIEMDPEFAAIILNGDHRGTMCDEPLLFGENIVMTPGITDHLECHLRGPLGDVQHLEKRCLCFRGSGNEITYPSDTYTTYREGAKAALQWVLEHGQGRFHDDSQ